MADTLQVLDWKGLGMERMCGYWRRHLTSVVEEYVFRSVKKCALAEGQLAASFSDESVDSTSLHELLSIQQNTNNWPEGEMQFIQGIMDGFQHIWQVAKSALVQPR